MRRAVLITELLILAIVLSGCIEQPEAASTAQTCAEIGGYACGTGESCFGAKLNASDATICCGTPCTITNEGESGEPPSEAPPAEPAPPVEEKSLEELNLKLSDFPEGFKVDSLETGYIRNALDYQDGNTEHAKQIVDNGWMENYNIVLEKDSEEEVLGEKILLTQYSASISKYDKSGNYENYFKESITERKEFFEDEVKNLEEIAALIEEENLYYELNSISLLDLGVGDNSVCEKRLLYNSYLETTVPVYYCYFTVENYYINYFAEGKGRNISDDDVIKYAKIIEQRIKS